MGRPGTAEDRGGRAIERQAINKMVGNFIVMTIYYNCILNKTVVHNHIMLHDYNGSIINGLFKIVL